MRHLVPLTRAGIPNVHLCCFALLIVGACAQQSAAVELVGYLPYYYMYDEEDPYITDVLPTQLGMLNEVRYFGLTVGSDGSILPHDETLDFHKEKISLLKQMIDAMPAGRRPRIDITFGGGGAGQSSNFAAVAASPTLSAKFAQNINSLLTATGATAVDIDWETPTTAENNNYVTMLHRIKQEVGTTRRVYTTIEPHVEISPTVLNDTNPNDGFENGIDGLSLMTYELMWWGDDPAHLSRGQHSPAEYVADTVDAWTQPPGSTNRRDYVFDDWGLGVKAAKLGIGLPLFGRTVSATPPRPTDPTSYPYSELATDWTADASGNYFTLGNETVWAPGPDLAKQRVQFANDRGLQQIFMWDLAQDLPPTTSGGLNTKSLLVASYLKNETLSGDFDGDHNVNAVDFNIWRSTFGKTNDLRADGNGNGIIDGNDYVVWRKHATNPGAGSLADGSVPEPTSLWLTITAAIATSRPRRLRRI